MKLKYLASLLTIVFLTGCNINLTEEGIRDAARSSANTNNSFCDDHGGKTLFKDGQWYCRLPQKTIINTQVPYEYLESEY